MCDRPGPSPVVEAVRVVSGVTRGADSVSVSRPVLKVICVLCVELVGVLASGSEEPADPSRTRNPDSEPDRRRTIKGMKDEVGEGSQG